MVPISWPVQSFTQFGKITTLFIYGTHSLVYGTLSMAPINICHHSVTYKGTLVV